MTYAMLLSSHRLIKVLAMMAMVATFVALYRPDLGARVFSAMQRGFLFVARSRGRAMAAAALMPLCIRALMLPWYPPPKPQIHDEFSYLLQADTFAHGRLANPVPPYGEHFESEYVLIEPTYASQYQPAQGLVLALGQVVAKSPWAGVWLSMGVMFAALYWALSLVFPAQWALAGVIGAALQFGIFGLWMNSYFGGAVAATAGVLVAGSLVRMKGRMKSSAALCAFGIILLFASRPFEALLWLFVAIIWVGLTFRAAAIKRVLGFAGVFGAVFAAGALCLAFYNWRITGNALLPPYLAYQHVYGTPQPFWWQSPVEIRRFLFPEIRDNYLNQVHLYQARYSAMAILKAEGARLRDFWRFFIGPFFTPCLVFLWWAIRDRRLRPWLFVSIPFVLDKATYHAWFPAQNAPETVLVVAVVLQCWRHMRIWHRRTRTGVALAHNLAFACGLTIALAGIGRAVEPSLPYELRHIAPIWESLYPARRLRDDVTVKLEQIPGRHLVFVNFGPGHCFCEEWIANGADIGSQAVIYAREMSLESDIELARRFEDHDVWVVEPDSRPYTLERLDDRDLRILAEVFDRKNRKKEVLSASARR